MLCFSALTLVALAVTARAYPPAHNQTDLETLFRPVLSSAAQIIYPSWANWTDEVQQRWSSYQAPTYTGAIKVATVSDIQHIIKLAAQHDIPFLVTGAGHGVSATLETMRDGINIDLSNLRYARLDETGNRLTIGGGTKFQEMWDVLYAAGKEIQTGAAQCVGSIGATLGAGIGPLQGHRGLMIDALEGVTLVTAEGEVVRASRTENAELFWGLRGAGWNFGVVVEASYTVYEATNSGQVLEGDMLFPASANRSVWETLRSFDDGEDGLPALLALTVILSYNVKLDMPTILVNFIYYGPAANAEPYIQRFRALQPLRERFNPVLPWNKLYTKLFFSEDASPCAHDLRLIYGGAGLKRTDVATFESYTNYFASFARTYKDRISASAVFSRFPTQAVKSAAGQDEMAYAFRDIETHVLFKATFVDEDPDAEHGVNAWVVESRERFARTSGFPDGELVLYNNYAHGDEGAAVLYGKSNLVRLAALKRRWDPFERFSTYHPVPLAYGLENWRV
ncbi:FAD-binding domain-containing protein [Aspergillus homomorphus CBS 101889]|uniref:FAD-binding domain-containing protein n=1 Tax=Aspergillus homomorphus (strain CBS 101889) TaxID=1450537 RepID=A0A395I8K4_ASPHC|nr:FAD-binding domain-containing protein [Aspergillus homomorphus CBS 101889]RAL16600.1 FAD-binding domain-containing protein [Aspergillus homomorphus CBS 101889]